MEFEFDSRKSDTNKKKHGIDFFETQELWNDPFMIELPAKSLDEIRVMVIGRIAGKHWSGIITCRGERIRIISVRRSRIKEIGIYESEGFG
jgi:uncharacterized DUF497 family protein